MDNAVHQCCNRKTVPVGAAAQRMGNLNSGIRMTNIQLWRMMLAASDQVLDDALMEAGETADRRLCEAHLRVIRDRLFPNGAPPGPWAIAEWNFWQQLQSDINECQTEQS